MTTPSRRYRGTDGIAAEPSASYFAERTPVLVDSNVLIDVLNDHPLWAEWSLAQLEPLVAARRAVIVPIVYAELAPGFATMEALEAALRPYRLVRDALSYPAAFLAGTAYGRYRRSGGTKRSPLPDFYIGAHASLSGCPVLTRDPRRYREYFPKLKVIAPDQIDDEAVMSKRFLRWAETWIEENIPPGANPDIESHDARAKRLSEKLLAEAAEAGFSNAEAASEMARVAPMVLAAVSDSTDFNIDAYRLKSLLAQENEDGD